MKGRLCFNVFIFALLFFSAQANACTSLVYSDLAGHRYSGRTMELPMELPYKLAFFPAGENFQSIAPGHKKLDFSSKKSFISIAVPDPVTKDLKVVEGLNDAGLAFSVLAFASTEGPKDMVDKTQSALAAIDLGAWILSQFSTADEAKAALEKQPTLVTSLLPLGALKTPFHYILHDAKGASMVIEYADGKQNIYDNPMGVMTNGPEFSWHLTNMNNYTHLSPVDKSDATIGGVSLKQPDSGIATASLPSSNTSVGRFVRAVYYSQYSEKAKTPEQAVNMLSHIMNNFDRPRGVSIDKRFQGAPQDAIAPGVTGKINYTTEYTSWTSLSDLNRLRFSVRKYDNLNYTTFDLPSLMKGKRKIVMPLSQISDDSVSGSRKMLSYIKS